MQFLPPKESFGRCRLYLILAWAITALFLSLNMYWDAESIAEAVGRPFYRPTFHDPSGPFCVILLISILSSCFGEAWHKMNASEKRIRQLEEKVEKLLAEKSERESAPVQVSNAPDDRYFSPR